MGRTKGALNMSTRWRLAREKEQLSGVETKIEAEVRRVVAAGLAKAELGKPSILRKLAIDELAEALPIIKGVAAHYQRQLDSGGRQAAELFRLWMTLYVDACAKLAPFQSPKFSAVMIETPKEKAVQEINPEDVAKQLAERGLPTTVFDDADAPVLDLEATDDNGDNRPNVAGRY
jgi:hypothetical protein